MSKLNYLHKVLNQSLKDDFVSTYEEVIIDGPKGITVKYFSKTADGEEKITIISKDNKFLMIIKKGDKKEEKLLSKEDLIAELKSNKKLKFATDFVKTQKGGAWLERPSKKRKTSSKKASSKKSSSKKVKKVRKAKKMSSKH